MNHDVFEFFKSCLQDDEVLAGGIPRREQYYLDKLGWDLSDDEVSAFYEALEIIIRLGRGDKAERLSDGRLRFH